MATFKLTDEMREALREVIYANHNVKHEFVPLDENDMRRELACSIKRSSKCSGHKATWLRANKVYCDTCKNRCDRERTRIVIHRAEPALAHAIKESTTAAKFKRILADHS